MRSLRVAAAAHTYDHDSHRRNPRAPSLSRPEPRRSCQGESKRQAAAVTGALQWIARHDFQQHPFNETYIVCGEDVELCMDVQQDLKKQVWLCAEATAVHESETTRSQDERQAGNSEDQMRLSACVKAFIEQVNKKQLKTLLMQQQRESMHLRDLVAGQLGEELKLEREEQEKVLLDLREERLRLKQQLDFAGGQQ